VPRPPTRRAQTAPTPPRPQPRPPRPTPTPSPAPTPRPTRPAPQAQTAPTPTPRAAPSPRPAPTPPAPSAGLDLDRLARDIAPQTSPRGRPTSGGAAGPARPPTSPRAAPDAGDGFSVAERNQLAERLMELWNPNCEVAGGYVSIRVRVQINAAGRLIGAPQAEGINSDNLIVRVNAERAVRAFRQAEQRGYLPTNLPESALTINFNPSRVCGG
jgi:hypothetical protein